LSLAIAFACFLCHMFSLCKDRRTITQSCTLFGEHLNVNYSRFDFNYAVFNLTVLEKYRPYASEPKGEDPSDGYINPTSPLNKNDCKDDLYSKLRCCLAHQFLMGENLNLSDSNENKLDVPPITLGVHAFYNDFEKACKEVLTKLSTEKELSELQQITHMVIEKTENGSSVSGHP